MSKEAGTLLSPVAFSQENPTGTSTEVKETIDTPIVIQKGIYLGKEVRIGSRKIRIEVIKKFNMLPNDPKAKQIRDEVIRKVASQWKQGTRDIIRGCSPLEEQIYLPKIIGLKPEHPDWETKVKDFWANFNFTVPADEGKELEAGFKFKVGSKNSEAEPINVNDFLSYNFAKENSSVANENEDNPITYTFRLIDVAAKDIENETNFSLRMIVDRLFNKLCLEAETIPTESTKIDWILETKGGPTGVGMSIHGLSNVQKYMELSKVKERDLAGFRNLLEDRELEFKALLRKSVTYRKVEQVGTSYFYNGIAMGQTEKAAISWIRDPSNSQYVILLVEALKEYSR